MRILLITRNLPPLWGGMERLNWHLAEQLLRFGEVYVVGPQGSGALSPTGVHVDECRLTPVWWFLMQAFWRSLSIARSRRPQIIIAGSGLTAPIAWMAARVSGASCAVYTHGLDVAVAHKLYRALWWPVFRKIDRFIANSHWTALLARRAGVRQEKIGVVFPGVAIPFDSPSRGVTAFRHRFGLGDRPILLSVGRLTCRKGLREFVADVLPDIVRRYPDVLLVVAGDVPTQSLRAEFQTPQSIQAVAAQNGVERNLLFLGVISDPALLEDIYFSAQVHVFPVREIPNDPEGFGMVSIEAAAHGVPTVAYATGGVVDAVKEGVSGYLVKPGDTAGFANAVVTILGGANNLSESARTFAGTFAWSHFGEAFAAQIGLGTELQTN